MKTRTMLLEKKEVIRHLPIIFSAIFLLTMCLPIQVLAGRITPTKTELGANTTASGTSSTAMGNFTKARGYASAVVGWNSTAYSAYERVIGMYSTIYRPVSQTDWNSSDRLFVIGNGTSDTNRSDAMVVLKNGNIGIGTSNPSYKLHVNGTAAGTSWTNLSSRDFKKDVRKVGETAHPMMLAKLMDMDLTTYKYKEMYGGDGTTKLGFIAEDTPEEVLSKDGKGVDVYELLTLTIGAMQAQQKTIGEQQKENEVLKAKLTEVMRRLEVLEK